MIGLVFAGQGSEVPYMGQDFYDAYEEVRVLYEKAEQLTKLPLREVVFQENDARLHETLYAQVLLFLFDVFVVDELKKSSISYDLVFGLSLGEYGALYASGVFDVETGLEVIVKRATLMSEACESSQGMAAILGLDEDLLYPLLNQKTVFLANYNTPAQLVISGLMSDVEDVMEQATKAGAKRVVKLSSSGAFHTPYMYNASQHFGLFLEDIVLLEPRCRLLLNTTGTWYETNMKKEMEKQIVSSVYFYQSVEEAIHAGVDKFIEIAPKSIVKSMIKKVNRTVDVVSVSCIEDIKQL